MLLAPDKSSIYPGELPRGTTYPNPAPADRFIAALRARGVRVVDVRAALRDAAARGEVYSKGDTHWNDAGAYIAYRATIAALGVRDTIPPSSIASSIEDGEGDLLRLAGIAQTAHNPVVTYAYPHHDPDPSLPAAVLFGDSFSVGITPFLAQDFRRLDVVRFADASGPQFDRALVERLRPAVVIQEIVERSLVVAGEFKP